MAPRILVLHSREEWRNLLRSLLRECSYLPDPIARSACHEQVILRFRRYHVDPKKHDEDIERLKTARREVAKKSLSVLRRANEGFTKPLEKVLKFAYGRSGRRRAELLNKLLQDHGAVNSDDVNALIAAADQFEKKWVAPRVATDLLRSQIDNPYVSQISDRTIPIKGDKPPGDMKNAWGRRMPLKRGAHYRRRWYKMVLDALLPPLPDSQLKVLEGLMSGAIPWSPPKRRSQKHTTSPADASDLDSKGAMIQTVLTDGPPKEGTFAAYKSGRPHNITRRFMFRLWKRISCLVPRHRWDAESKKHIFEWDTASVPPDIAVSAKEDSSLKILGGSDTESKTLHKPKETTKRAS
ncbi:uncharacterized protein ANIA_06716 [Aspergillus nidulans FGSC A4]|uniref:LYR motif-containing protein Cup1-like N-terminal domain-containing protein n=1 Tax=Emericella nidulans (strain FGSC A4 / ATCC 38163 / CBS 112.46 / NRRL 194 / M139) TaxID=227321 RepID=C8V1V1_EMENI|nr:hypothetical protein [Aspergillus nidulans FGSC A4]CBF71310.1 TPA: conserved hypothetical protein [Aspergillus nidulans FGSC A4]